MLSTCTELFVHNLLLHLLFRLFLFPESSFCMSTRLHEGSLLSLGHVLYTINIGLSTSWERFSTSYTCLGCSPGSKLHVIILNSKPLNQPTLAPSVSYGDCGRYTTTQLGTPLDPNNHSAYGDCIVEELSKHIFINPTIRSCYSGPLFKII